MVEITLSIKGRTCSGRWYPERNGLPDRISIFVNIIAENINPDTTRFEKALGVMFLHEYIHINFYRSGCKSGANCRAGNCFWCSQTYEILEYII